MRVTCIVHNNEVITPQVPMSDRQICSALFSCYFYGWKHWKRWKPLRLYAGVLVGVMGWLAPIEAQIVNPPPPSIAIRSTHFAAKNLLTIGQEAYNRGALQEAWSHWNQALTAATTPGETIATLNALGIVEQDLGQWEKAEAWFVQAQSLLDSFPHPQLQAQVWNSQGNLQFRQGQVQEALQLWQQSQQQYEAVADPEGSVLSQINQIYALKSLGFYDRVRKKLDHLKETIATLPVGAAQVNTLQSLGHILQDLGRSEEAATVLEQAFALADQANLERLKAEVVLDQATLYASLADSGDFSSQTITPEQVPPPEKALQYFEQARRLNLPLPLAIESNLNEFRLLLTLQRPIQALDRFAHLQEQLANLSPSRFSVATRINAAHALIQARNRPTISPPFQPFAWPDSIEIAQLLQTAIQGAQHLGDSRLQSFAIGQLGSLYEHNQQYPEALTLTRQALLLAQTVQAEDAQALWQWQAGRILRQQGDQVAALAAYQAAVQTLQRLRQDLVGNTTDLPFSFRESVEPVYREFTALLLENLDQQSPDRQQDRLRQAREAIDALQLAELENFFREACLDFTPQSIDALDPDAAVIYPILLPNALEVIISLPHQPLRHHRVDLDDAQRRRIFQQIRQNLNPAFPPDRIVPLGSSLYDWLLRPWDSVLKTQGIKTIVFALDGPLRNIPMAILHDGEQFLIENYNLALVPSLKLIDVDSTQPSDRIMQSKTLVGGLSISQNGFPDLPYVQLEIEDISNIIRSKSILLNQSFTQQNITQKLQNYPASIIHLATHGQFSSNAEQTFLLTWDGKINVRRLDEVLRNRNASTPLELLVLSACQSAQGDERALLGLAGMAIRSGARSTLGTLWPINDRSTAEFMTYFYQNLQQGQEKARALRNAQLTLLHSEAYDHPYYWAPFVLIGRWH